MMQSDVDFSDIQGIVRFGYGKMTQAAYLLARVKNADAARAWLRAAPVSTAVTMSPAPRSALQVAFTAAGLAALGVPATVLNGFSSEFSAGMTESSRLRRSGDVGRNSPSQWDWGRDDGHAGSAAPHLVAMFFAEPGAENGGGLEAFMRRTTGAPWEDGFDTVRRLDTTDLGGVEAFGFTDGISQPEIDWEQRRDPTLRQVDYGNVVALGEVVLGYRNEYGKYTDRPLLDASDATGALLPALDSPMKKDLGRNGTYLVMRQLAQDVRTFWQFTARQAAAGGDPVNAERIPAAFVGRARSGEPLVPLSHAPIPGIGSKPDEVRLNQFTFESDPAGARCPFGSHVRRVNPRNADFVGRPSGLGLLAAKLGLTKRGYRDDLTSSVRFHRIIRRGREYGPALSRHDALLPAPPGDPERGLHFLCLNANISRQFEFLQNAWVMNTKFSGLTGASDPLLGNREPIPGCPDGVCDFALEQTDSAPRRVTGLPQFITMRGGAYFFLPSIRAIQYFAGTASH